MDSFFGSGDSWDNHGVSKSRLWIAGSFFGFFIFLIMIRLCYVSLTPQGPGVPGAKIVMRAPILDRNGYVLASSLDTFSVYAHPEKIVDKREAIAALIAIFPEIKKERLVTDFNAKKPFIWIARHVAPSKKMRVNALGIQGLNVLKDSKRIYPHDRLFCHVLGTTDLDQNGLSGLELSMNQQLLQSSIPLKTSLDLRLQHILYDTLAQQIHEFQAFGGNGVMVDLKTGEILAMVSFPDFSPLEPIKPTDAGYFNRNMTGVYEFGSIMKIINTALLLENNKGTLRSVFDASHPLYIGRHRVTDFRGQNRPLTVEEAFIHSSNIAHAKMAAFVGESLQKQFFKKMGFDQSIKTELGRCAWPLFPKGKWALGRVMTAGYGYGFAVTPLHMAACLGTLATGVAKPLTFLADPVNAGKTLLKKSTVKDIVYLLGQAVLNGQAKKAAAYNCLVGAKTGTANVLVSGKYADKQNITSCVGIFPIDAPRYGIVISIDRAKPSAKTYGFATAGWMAAPVISRLVEQMAPLLGVMNPLATGSSSKNTPP